MKRRLVFIASYAFVLIVLLSLIPNAAQGGMGSVVPQDWARAMRLTDSALARFQAISFFLAVLLLSAVVLRWLWNWLAKDIPALPRLTFGKSVAVLLLWGLLFLVVLTMIAATREMMTPGAWRKVGVLYQVAENPAPPPRVDRRAERKQHFERLQAALWQFASQHHGQFPETADESIPASLWELPGGAGLRYLYVPHRSVGKPSAILAYEPAVYGDDRLVLYCDGQLTLVQTVDIQKQLSK